jgi:UPF0716 family protein affecting phage T7 exclusion
MQALFQALWRVLLLATGAVLGLLALTFGLLLTVAVVGWALLRGRKPVRVQTFRWQDLSRRGRAPAGEVVDIDAREVRDGKTAPTVLSER